MNQARIALLVEGDGEVQALPVLGRRIAQHVDSCLPTTVQ